MVSDSTLSTDMFTAIRNIIVAKAPYVTNSTTSSTTAASIVAQYADKQTNRPQIVIHPIMVEENTWKFGGFQGKKIINVVVDCYHSTSLGTDQLFDQVNDAMKTNIIDGVDLIGIASDIAFTNPNESKFHMKSGTYVYDKE